MNFMENHSFRESIEQRGSYLSKGLYAEQFKIWSDIFSKDQIHVLSTEEMQKNPRETLLELFRFLGLPDYDIKNPQKQKFFKYKEMSSNTRKKLLDFYKPHNEKFFQMIEKRFDWDN